MATTLYFDPMPASESASWSSSSPSTPSSSFSSTTSSSPMSSTLPPFSSFHPPPVTPPDNDAWSSSRLAPLKQLVSPTDFNSPTSHPPIALFVAQNTASMICYLWFSTTLPAPRGSKSRSTIVRPKTPPPLSPHAATEAARLQFVPSPHFVAFLGSLLSTTQVSQSVIVLALHYIYRLKLANPVIGGQEGSEFRLAVIALMLANKFVDDNTYTNKTWSDVSGISLSEINTMEREFLLGIDNRLYVDVPTYDNWLNLLSGLLLAKEREATKWKRGASGDHRRAVNVAGITVSPVSQRREARRNYSPSSVRKQPGAAPSVVASRPIPRSPLARKSSAQRARSTSPPTSRNPPAYQHHQHYPPPAQQQQQPSFPFTFEPPPINHANPFIPPLAPPAHAPSTSSSSLSALLIPSSSQPPIVNTSAVLLTATPPQPPRPGSKRSARDAFSPTSATPPSLKPVKAQRPLSGSGSFSLAGALDFEKPVPAPALPPLVVSSQGTTLPPIINHPHAYRNPVPPTALTHDGYGTPMELTPIEAEMNSGSGSSMESTPSHSSAEAMMDYSTNGNTLPHALSAMSRMSLEPSGAPPQSVSVPTPPPSAPLSAFASSSTNQLPPLQRGAGIQSVAIPPPRTLSAAYRHDRDRFQMTVPQYLTFHTLASSPMAPTGDGHGYSTDEFMREQQAQAPTQTTSLAQPQYGIGMGIPPKQQQQQAQAQQQQQQPTNVPTHAQHTHTQASQTAHPNPQAYHGGGTGARKSVLRYHRVPVGTVFPLSHDGPMTTYDYGMSGHGNVGGVGSGYAHGHGLGPGHGHGQGHLLTPGSASGRGNGDGNGQGYGQAPGQQGQQQATTATSSSSYGAGGAIPDHDGVNYSNVNTRQQQQHQQRSIQQHHLQPHYHRRPHLDIGAPMVIQSAHTSPTVSFHHRQLPVNVNPANVLPPVVQPSPSYYNNDGYTASLSGAQVTLPPPVPSALSGAPIHRTRDDSHAYSTHGLSQAPPSALPPLSGLSAPMTTSNSSPTRHLPSPYHHPDSMHHHSQQPIQLAPFANAGPPGVQWRSTEFYHSTPSTHHTGSGSDHHHSYSQSGCTPAYSQQHSSHQQQQTVNPGHLQQHHHQYAMPEQAQTFLHPSGSASTWSSPVTRGRRM